MTGPLFQGDHGEMKLRMRYLLAATVFASITMAGLGARAATPDLGSRAIVEAGRLQFAQTCVYCHGNAGSGGKAGPLAGNADLTPDYVFTTISNGKHVGSLNMPAWKESLDENTIWSLTAYIMSLQAKQ